VRKPAKVRYANADPQEGKAGDAAAVWVPIGSLRPWDKNPRDNDAAVDSVVESIKAFGWGRAMVATADGEVVVGHTSLKAAHKLGCKTVPVRFRNLTPKQAHMLAMADNKIGEKAQWVPSGLVDFLRDHSAEETALAGWDIGERTELLSVDDPMFGMGMEEEQGNLDRKIKVEVKCPSCGHRFEL
jgi:hypothetical protein